MMKNKKLMLIDGNALIHRGFHALPNLRSPQGQPTGASFGFTSIFLKALENLKPDYAVVTFDLPGKTFRHKEYKEYKAKRIKAPQELYDQIPQVKELCEAFNLPKFEKEGFEADDLIATITNILKNQKDLETYIVTGDLDTLQLVSDKTKIFAPIKGFSNFKIYDKREVFSRYGIKPSQIVDLKALKGDPSDNIPGVAGIGEKGAAGLIKKFSTLENLYKNLKDVPEKYQKLLKNQKKQAFESQKLCQLVSDVPIKFALPDARLSDYDPDRVKKVFQKLAFLSLLKRLPQSSRKEFSPETLFGKTKTEFAPKELKIISNVEQIHTIDSLKSSDWIVLDTKIPQKTDLKNLRIALGDEKNNLLIDLPKASQKAAGEKLSGVLKDKKIIGHDLKEDYKELLLRGIKLENLYFDTVLAAYLLNPEFSNFNLRALAFDFLGVEIAEPEELSQNKTLDQKTISKIALEKLEIIKKLYQLFEQKTATPKFSYVKKLTREIELPLVPVLAKMEIVGVKIDPRPLNSLSRELKIKVKNLTDEIHALAKTKFNINSPSQLKEILFQKLKISTKEIKKTKTGLSTAASELEKLRGKHKIIDKILEYRELAKLISTYIDVLPNLADNNNRIHTTFNQAQTRTGRLSSENPNLQNIPTRTEIGEKIRSAFVTDAGMVFISADYSQFDLRVAASISGDAEMKKTFQKDQDIHLATGEKLFDVGADKVTKSMRRVAKTVNFGILYGMNFFGLAERLGIERDQAKKFIEEYFAHFPGIKDYTEKIIDRTRKLGYAETLLGRRRYIPEINSKTVNIRKGAERIAINMPIQGTSADIMKLAMIKLDQVFSEKKIKLLLQVHDELLFEADAKDAEKFAGEIAKVMESIYKLKVPLKVDLKIGKNWSELEKIPNSK